MNSNELINKINARKKKNIPLFGSNNNPLANVHDKVINRMKGVNNNNQQNQMSNDERKVEGIVNADVRIREGVKDLAEALFELNDKEVAQKIIAEHIMMLNELFKTFE